MPAIRKKYWTTPSCSQIPQRRSYSTYYWICETLAAKTLTRRRNRTMNKQKLVRAFAIATVALLGLLPSTSISSAADPIGSMGPVPKAHCGRFDFTESGLQGQTTTWERESGDSEGGYNCNLELVGQFRGEGAFSQDGPAFLDHCAYYATENDPLQQHPGVVVIDVSDPKNPRPTAYLDDTPAALNPHENLKVNLPRKLLGVAES